MTGADVVYLAQVLQTLAEALVDRPEEVRVLRRQVEGVVSFTVQVSAGELGRVIGKQGRTARSVRTILNAASAKHGVRCEVNFVMAKEECGQ